MRQPWALHQTAFLNTPRSEKDFSDISWNFAVRNPYSIIQHSERALTKLCYKLRKAKERIARHRNHLTFLYQCREKIVPKGLRVKTLRTGKMAFHTSIIRCEKSDTEGQTCQISCHQNVHIYSQTNMPIQLPLPHLPTSRTLKTSLRSWRQLMFNITGDALRVIKDLFAEEDTSKDRATLLPMDIASLYRTLSLEVTFMSKLQVQPWVLHCLQS